MRRLVCALIPALMLLLIGEFASFAAVKPKSRPAGTLVPFVRFWRGFRLPGLDFPAFRNKLVKEFIPATLKTPGRYGLSAYMVAVPLPSGKIALPDEVALVIYRDENAYNRMNETPEGRAYQKSHWGLFSREISLSLVPRPFNMSSRIPTERGAAFDVLGIPVDWNSGQTFFFFGLRKPSLTPENFFRKLKTHVACVKSSFASQGLKGYLVLITGEYEIAFLNWESGSAMQKAMSTPKGKALFENAKSIQINHMWAPVKRYDGWLEPGDCSDVRFLRR